MPDYSLSMVSQEALDEQIARPFIERVAARTRGARTADGILARIRRGEWQLWLVAGSERVVAAIGTALFIRDDGRKSCDITFIAGDGLRVWGDGVLSEIEQWAAREGCTVMNATARPGMRVVLGGYRAGAVEFTKEL